MSKKILIDELSACSVRVEPHFQQAELATATGFTTSYDGQTFLVTNWHVVSGRNADTGECLDPNLAIPDRMFVTLHSSGGLGAWQRIEVALLGEDGQKLWKEHPLGSSIDVVAVPLSPSTECVCYPLDLALADADMVLRPAMPVSVIGYPLGLSAGGNWPIWKTGHVASDPDVDFQADRPAFLIDATTRSGMSGSPVVLRLSNGYSTRENQQILGGPLVTKFLGVYAGRIHPHAEIGRVWRPFLILEILAGKLLFDAKSGRELPSRNHQCPCRSGVRFKYCCGRLEAS